MTAEHGVDTATGRDTARIAELITEAFLTLPPSVWLVGEVAERRRVLGRYFTHLVQLALEAGSVATTPDRTAAALWFPHGVAIEAPPTLDELTAVVGAGHADRFLTFEEHLHKHHPVGVPHHHLAVLAVSPQRQGRGIGTALMREHHRCLDAEGIPAYLEAASDTLPTLYARHGYERAPVPIRLPEDGTTMWPMWRAPRPVTR